MPLANKSVVISTLAAPDLNCFMTTFLWLWVHISMQDRDYEVVLGHTLLELFDTFSGVAVDDCLVDVHLAVQVEEQFKLPLSFLAGNVVLLDAFECHHFLLNKNPGRLVHELRGKVKNVLRESC